MLTPCFCTTFLEVLPLLLTYPGGFCAWENGLVAATLAWTSFLDCKMSLLPKASAMGGPLMLFPETWEARGYEVLGEAWIRPVALRALVR